MDRYLDPNTPEARAHNIINENLHWEDDEQYQLNEQLIALCASYTALARYIKGADIYIHPRSFAELESKLRRYAYDAIHNTIAHSRIPLETGGYGRVCNSAEKSIRALMTTNTNAADLLSMHRRRAEHTFVEAEGPNGHAVTIN